MTRDLTLLGFLVSGAGVVAGAHMMLRPVTYLGRGSVPARDPRTVRFFGGLTVLFAGFNFILIGIRLAQG